MSSDFDVEGKPKLAMEVLSCKDNGSGFGDQLVRLDNGSVSENPLASNNNGGVSENPSNSVGNGGVLQNPSTGKENGNVFENLMISNDNGSTLEDPSASKETETFLVNVSNDNGSALEDGGSALEQPLPSKDIGSVLENLRVLENAEDKFLRCANNQEDDTFHMEALLGEQSRELDKSEDADVDIMENVNSGATGLFEANNHDMTESSSSFGDTFSEHENGSGFSDAEVNSELISGTKLVPEFDECGKAFRVRKKKLTDHWRRFIHPIMWRCRWIELQLKELNSQESRYESELAKYDQRKQFELEKHILEEVGAKSLPFCSQVQRTKLMKRKKRKRAEDTTDIASHMSHHNLFSYFENKKSFSDGTYMDDNGSNPVFPTEETINGNDEFGINDECLALQFRDADDSLERILWKIDAMQSQVQQLRTRVDKVVSEIPKKFSSINMMSLLVPCDALASSHDPVSLPYIGDGLPIQYITDCDMGDLIMPDSAVLTHEEVAPLLNMNGSRDQPKVGAPNENTEARIQRIVKEESQVPGEKQVSTAPSNLIPGADQPIKNFVAHVHSTVKSVTSPKTNVPNNKRKRGRRKAGSRR